MRSTSAVRSRALSASIAMNMNAPAHTRNITDHDPEMHCVLSYLYCLYNPDCSKYSIVNLIIRIPIWGMCSYSILQPFTIHPRWNSNLVTISKLTVSCEDIWNVKMKDGYERTSPYNDMINYIGFGSFPRRASVINLKDDVTSVS